MLPPIDLRPEGEPYKPLSSVVSETLPSTPDASSPSAAPALSLTGSRDPSLRAVPQTIPLSSSSSDLTPLLTSPAGSDPLSSDVGGSEPPSATTENPSPQLTLTDDATSTGIEEAMGDSVMTVIAKDTRQDKAAEPTKVSRANTSGADLILPIIIFAVVKSNPPQLASHLMFLRRYRSAICLTGEASYAIVNLTAVVEFLEHVDLAELGLGSESDKVIR